MEEAVISSSEKIQSIYIYDCQGRIVDSKTAINDYKFIYKTKCSLLGLYYAKVVCNRRVFNFKFIQK